MWVLVLVPIAIAAAAGAYFLTTAIRTRRTPPELRGDWWTSFERDFRAYASAMARHRQHGQRGSASR